jgi:hypothetical protein
MDDMSLIPLPIDFRAKRFYAETIYERIEELVKNRIDNLRDNEELLITVPLLDGSRIAVEEFGFQNPGFIIAYGVDSETGSSVEVYLSYMNVQLVFSVTEQQVESNKPRRTIGFRGDWESVIQE